MTVHVHVLWTVCTHTIPFPNVVVSVTIHDDMCVLCFFLGRTPTDGELSLRCATTGETLVESRYWTCNSFDILGEKERETNRTTQ